MKPSIALYGNAYSDTILTVADFPQENKANEVLATQQQEGGIHNVYRDLLRLDEAKQSQLFTWKQSLATIIYNVSTAQRTSLVYKQHETAQPEVTEAAWHHVCYLDDLATVSLEHIKQMQHSGKVSIDFCKRSDKSNYLKLLDYADYVFCSKEDLTDSDHFLEKLNHNTVAILHDKTGSESYQANQLILDYRVPNVVEKVNPLGAGDAFAAAFINSCMQGDKLDESIARAHQYATEKIVEENHE